MAAITELGTRLFDTNSGTHTVTATPAVGDLILLLVANTGYSGTTLPTDNNAGGGGTYTLVKLALKATSADRMQLYVRNALITSATSTIFTHAAGTTSGGGLAVFKVTGMTTAGLTAIRGSGGQDNAASGTPTVSLTQAAITGNPVFGAVFSATAGTAVAQRSSPAYSEVFDIGYSVPTTGIEVMKIDSGETAQSIAWGGAAASAFCALAAEINAPRQIAGTAAMLLDAGPAIIYDKSIVGIGLRLDSRTFGFQSDWFSYLNRTPALAIAQGSGVAAMTLGGAATGVSLALGTGSAAMVFGAAAPNTGMGALAGAGAMTLGGSAVGKSLALGSGVAALTLDGAAVGKSIAFGSGTAALAFDAAGTFPPPSGAMTGAASLSFGASATGILTAQGSGQADIGLSASATISALAQMNGQADLSLGGSAFLWGLAPMFGTAEMVFQQSVLPTIGAIIEKSGIASISFGASAVLGTTGGGYLGRRIRPSGMKYYPYWIDSLVTRTMDTQQRTASASMTLDASATISARGALAGVASMAFDGQATAVGQRNGAGTAAMSFGATATFDPVSFGNMSGVASLSFGASANAVQGFMSGVASMTFRATYGDVASGIGKPLLSGFRSLYPPSSFYYITPQNNYPTQLVAAPVQMTLNAIATIRGIGNMSGVASMALNAAANLGGALHGTADLSFGATATLSGLGSMAGSADLTLNATASSNIGVVAQGVANMRFGATATITRKSQWTPEIARTGTWSKKAAKGGGWTKEAPKDEDWIKETGT